MIHGRETQLQDQCGLKHLAWDDVGHQNSSSSLEVPAGVQKDMRLVCTSFTAVLHGLSFDIKWH